MLNTSAQYTHFPFLLFPSNLDFIQSNTPKMVDLPVILVWGLHIIGCQSHRADELQGTCRRSPLVYFIDSVSPRPSFLVPRFSPLAAFQTCSFLKLRKKFLDSTFPSICPYFNYTGSACTGQHSME